MTLGFKGLKRTMPIRINFARTVTSIHCIDSVGVT